MCHTSVRKPTWHATCCHIGKYLQKSPCIFLSSPICSFSSSPFLSIPSPFVEHLHHGLLCPRPAFTRHRLAPARAPPPARLLAGDRVPVAHHLAPPTRSRRCHEGRRTQPPRAPVRGKETGRARRARPRPPPRPPWLGTEHRAEGSSRPLTGRRLHLGAMASSCSCPGRGAPPCREPAATMARARRRGARSPTGLGGVSSKAAAEGEGG